MPLALATVFLLLPLHGGAVRVCAVITDPAVAAAVLASIDKKRARDPPPAPSLMA